MPAKIIDGKKIADEIKESLKQEIAELKKFGCTPGLAVVIVGNNPASEIYVAMKGKTASEVGIDSSTISLPGDISQSQLLQVIGKLNADHKVHGILVQLPLPPHIKDEDVINSIAPAKDVDGFHPVNFGKLARGEDTFVPCTPLGIQTLLVRSNIETAGRHVVIVGRSKIVGLPLATMFLQKGVGANSTVTVCHTGTPDLKHHTKQADILVAAIGKPEIITGEMVQPGVVVIDVGVNRIRDEQNSRGYRVVGDAEFVSVREKALAITPVPGGVGPMTIVMLIQNTLKAARQICASSSTG